MHHRSVPIRRIAAAVPLLLSAGSRVFAQQQAITLTDSSGSNIGASLTTLINWLSTVLGAGLVAVGVVIIGIRLAMHDEKALQKGVWVVVGGLIIFLAGNIVKLLQFIAGGRG
jgi:type IV secretory pathway VirB2 component (pilin)